MQYKIPVQIENEDKIFLNLSLRQIGIIVFFGGIGYSMFKSLGPNIGEYAALFPSGFVVLLGIFIALFKHTEMTFVPFMLNLLRLNLNSTTRVWSKGVDTFPEWEIGYIRKDLPEKVDVNAQSNLEIYEGIEDKIKNI